MLKELIGVPYDAFASCEQKVRLICLVRVVILSSGMAQIFFCANIFMEKVLPTNGRNTPHARMWILGVTFFMAWDFVAIVTVYDDLRVGYCTGICVWRHLLLSVHAKLGPKRTDLVRAIEPDKAPEWNSCECNHLRVLSKCAMILYSRCLRS